MGFSGGSAENRLLQMLRPDDLELMRLALTPWHGKQGETLHEPGDELRFAYFPCGPSVVSYLVVFEDRRPVETVLIGNEGMAGGIVSDGAPRAYVRAQVQLPGPFLRIALDELEQAKSRSPWLRQLFARYAEYLFASLFQSIACNTVHSIHQRTAKWLMIAMERAGDRRIPLTQEQLSTMMGVRRSYVSRVLQTFKAKSVVDTGRAKLIVEDLDRLQGLACDCGASVRTLYDELLTGAYPPTSAAEAADPPLAATALETS